jgi:topoisomerase-4 subunit A
VTDFAKEIIDATLEDELGSAFGRYAQTTILSRAIPDVRDGLKPVQRRIIYAMYLAKNGPDNRYRKSAKTVGEVMGNFHPHGDSSIYEALVRMAQSWKMRAPLIDGHGNFGSIDDDPPAAMRYTEARLAQIAVELTRDIQKDTVAFQPNFDDHDTEPTVLPARFPNLLVNGTSGVSTGFATEIQPHNLGECIDAVIAMIEQPKITLDGLMEHIKGPDFPTGGIMMGLDGLRKAYETGKGRVVLRARTSIETMRDNRKQIVVTEIPYGVIKSNLVTEMERMRTEKIVPGIRDVRDETDREGLRIVVDLGRGVAAEPVLAFLYKKTSLQVYRHFHMVAIHERSPQQMSLQEILSAYLAHQEDVVRRRSEFDLAKAQKRLHLVEGLIKAIDVLDEVIAIIRGSKDRADAHQNLMATFDFTDEQTREILEMRLHRLTNLQILQLTTEREELEKTIEQLERILGSRRVLRGVVKRELIAVKKQFADERRTTIVAEIDNYADQIRETVTVKEQAVVVGVSRDGYLKRSSVASYEKTEDVLGGVREGDEQRWILESSTLHRLVMFTENGHCFSLPVHQLPETKWGDAGSAAVNLVQLDKEDRLIKCMIVPEFNDTDELLFVTRQGSIKRTLLKNFDAQRAKGVSAIKLSEGDNVVNVTPVKADNHVMLSTREGNSIRFPLDQVSVQGRAAGGVRGIKLSTNDRVVASTQLAAEDDGFVGIITEEGKAKRTSATDFPMQNRGGRGVRCVRKRARLPHRIATVVHWPTSVTGVEEVKVITADGTSAILAVKLMRQTARDGNGYEFMDIDRGNKVVFSKRMHNPMPEGYVPEEELEPTPEAEAATEPQVETEQQTATETVADTAEELVPPGESPGERGGWARSGFLPGFEPDEG